MTMRIMLVGRNAQIGGGSTFRLNIGRGLISRGHEVALAAMGGPMVARYREAGIRYHWVPPFPIFTARLAAAIRSEGVNLVHASNTTAGDLALMACRRAGVPLVVSLHNTIADHESRHPCLKEARRIIVFDAGAAASAGKFTQEFDTEKIVRAPRPVEHCPADQREISPLHLVYVARLSSRKGKVALSLLEAFASLARESAGARLTILGDGSMRKAVAERAAQVSAATRCPVEVRGQVVDPLPVMRTAGVVIGAGYAALEAVMQGRAVIGAGFNGFGLVTASNVLDALDCNFGDTVHRWNMTPENFLAALRTARDAWKTPSTRMDLWELDRIVAPRHGIPAVAARLEQIYAEAIAVPAGRQAAPYGGQVA
jgi:glycosyltransferase involved in cell wall biosynthesis